MKQRVMIAQAMACDPEVLIADEPTTALDTTVQARIIELIVEMQERSRAAVLYISHDLSVVRTVCDRVGVMYAGQLVEVGTVPTGLRLAATPVHPGASCSGSDDRQGTRQARGDRGICA